MSKKAKRNTLARPYEPNIFSKVLREIIEKVHHKRIIAANIAVLATVFNVIALPSHAFDYQTAIADPTIQTQLSTITESAYQFPTTHPIGISQYYGTFHPGVDIRAPRGSQAVTIAQGVVIQVEFMKTGYGHFVRVAHAGTISSLYAHLDQVSVKVGDKVEKGQEIGKVGLTGWTTGPHLHFELYEGTKTINPALALAI